jgi:hypothetical protein
VLCTLDSQTAARFARGLCVAFGGIDSMGRQVNFYMHPNDLLEFEADLRSRSTIYLLQSKWPSSEPCYVSSTHLKLGQRLDLTDLTVYLCRQEDAKHLAVQHRSSLGYWTVDIRLSPVLEFWRSYFDGKVLKRGRLYYKPEGRTPGFVKWADSLIRRVRRTYIKEDFYVGPHAAKWRAECDGKFLQL